MIKKYTLEYFYWYLDLFVGVIIVTRDIIEKSCIPFGLGSIGCQLTSFIQVFFS